MKKNNLKYKEYKIISKIELAPNTFFFRFGSKIDMKPGQFVQVMLDHYGEATFAPCSNLEEHYLELCIRACGSTTNQLIRLVPGDTMKIRGPYGNGWPMHKLVGKNILLIAGGMGIVPLRPLVFELLKYKKEFKKITLIAGFKTNEHILFDNDLLDWQKKLDLFLMLEHKTSPSWGETGLITKPIKNLVLTPKNTLVLICGPEIMFPFCNEALIQKGINEEDIFISFERHMECGIGICQHCNIGKYLVCKDVPVFAWNKIKNELNK